jgi:uncharacterized Zn-finger protein
LPGGQAVAKGAFMASTDPFVPETTYVTSPRVVCDGATEISPALGHPRVYLRIDEKGYVDCGYCDKRFVLKGGPADIGEGAQAA